MKLCCVYDVSYLHRFHSREYPQYDEKIFPINLGYCQKGKPVLCLGLQTIRASFIALENVVRVTCNKSDLFVAGSKIPYDKSMDLRNILWLAPLATCTDKGVCSDDWLASGTSRSLLRTFIRKILLSQVYFDCLLIIFFLEFVSER